MTYSSMDLKILLPAGVFVQEKGVKRIEAETTRGYYGLWPNRLDCVAALVPGIFFFETLDGKETYLAVDQGIMVKMGAEVLVSVRNAIGGMELGKLHEAVKKEFLQLDEKEKEVRNVMIKLETRFLRLFHDLKSD